MPAEDQRRGPREACAQGVKMKQAKRIYFSQHLPFLPPSVTIFAKRSRPESPSKDSSAQAAQHSGSGMANARESVHS